MLETDNYSFFKETAIQEKKPFTEDRMNEYASNGTFYFKVNEITNQS